MYGSLRGWEANIARESMLIEYQKQVESLSKPKVTPIGQVSPPDVEFVVSSTEIGPPNEKKTMALFNILIKGRYIVRPKTSLYPSYKWDFGDGTTSEEWAPSKIYEDPGVYSAKLRLVDKNGKVLTLEKKDCVTVER